jgi:pyrroloquinoline quinone biosynthesis protein B
MLIKVLGSSAGGGFPQWNCNGRNSADVRQGVAGLAPRSQASVALSADGRQWVLLNATPDLRQQINDTPELYPTADGPPRNSPIKAVVLTNGDVDAIAGLLCLREGQPFTVYGSARVLGILSSNSIFDVLNPDLVKRMPVTLGEGFAVQGPDEPVGLTIEAFAVPAKIPLYLEDETAGPDFGAQEGDTVGLKITEDATGRHFFYIPGCARLDERLRARLKDAPLLFFDGTLYTNDEMVAQGLLNKTGDRMGHINMSGEAGSVAGLAPLNVKRKIFIHINNSNPVLRDGSPERKAVEAAGWEVSYDGMEVRV